MIDLFQNMYDLSLYMLNLEQNMPDLCLYLLDLEQYMLDLEREAFLSLCGEKKTQERIAFTLKTGKPLRN